MAQKYRRAVNSVLNVEQRFNRFCNVIEKETAYEKEQDVLFGMLDLFGCPI